MDKLKLFLDFDNTLVNTNKVAVEYFNTKFGKAYKLEDLKNYNFMDLFPEISGEDIDEFFNGDFLFTNISFIGNSREVLEKFDEFLQVSIVSMCTESNKITKLYWIAENLPQFSEFYGVETGPRTDEYNSRWAESEGGTWSSHDKSSVDMSGGIFIDDHIDCLRSSNAKIKILFRFNQDGDWNEFDNTDEIYVVNTWAEIEDILKFYIKLGEVV